MVCRIDLIYDFNYNKIKMLPRPKYIYHDNTEAGILSCNNLRNRSGN